METVMPETAMPETASCARRFAALRGVKWRVDLGILPSSPSATIDDLRRVTADSRRRYAALRRQLLVDPHVPKDGSSSPDPVIDNPLSQNPDSMWGRFFRNAELERMVDQDLTRLYPERGSYFQTSGCQGILRRILLLWCLSHPEYGYRQGMHELLAPLVYVLHVDLERLSEVRKNYEDHFVDNFDGFSFHENDLTYKFEFKKFSESVEDGSKSKKSPKIASLTELDPVIQTIILLSDAYGAEGELGIVLSEKFMEHDAYSMFDALMSGAGGAVAMAEFFSPSPYRNSHSMFTPVIEASAAMYHLLSIVDASLYTHLVELGVEPQYFSLRWLRVLFGREFSLEELLLIWDEIFACDNTRFMEADDAHAESNSGVLDSPRGAFISAFAVSMILMIRSSLLATETATACLQRLLNFPDDASLMKLVEKAKSLQTLAVDVNHSSSLLVHPGFYDEVKPGVTRGYNHTLDATSPRTPLSDTHKSYWEEKWRVLHHKEEEYKQAGVEEKVPHIRKGWSDKVKLHHSKTESDPSSPTKSERSNLPDPTVRKSLLNDLARQLGADDNEVSALRSEDVEHQDPIEVNGQEVANKTSSDTLSAAGSEENCPNLSNPPSPSHTNIDHENVSERSSVASNSSVDGNDTESCRTNTKSSPLLGSSISPDVSSRCSQNDDSLGKSPKLMHYTRTLSGKFNWLLKLGRNANEGTSERPSTSEGAKDSNGEIGQNSAAGCDVSSISSKGETVNQNSMVSLRNLAQSMLENIQVIESVFQQDHGEFGPPESLLKNSFVGEGQVTAMSALKELRKISRILSEM
ncbi:uncharacterized protein LOC131021327 [Salvia miltiorrhiza]|uniref:uncharacterized protein LOC131021327 n=1 Tax=Salvia miltiorrhiza TaxID=226208 RepID=UPI0025ACDD68|nr:uncharacterized protein LOC131021327 [Salvia miltiorrhiza]